MNESIHVSSASLCNAAYRFDNKQLQTEAVTLTAGTEGLQLSGSERRYHARATVFTYDPLRPLEAEVNSSQLAKACRLLFPPNYAAQIAQIENTHNALTIKNSICNTRAVFHKKNAETNREPPLFSFESPEFYRILKLVSFAALNDDNHYRPELSRIYFSSEAGKLHITAADGYRYSRYTIADSTMTPGIAFAVEKEFLVRAERFIAGKSRMNKQTEIRTTESHLVISDQREGIQAEIPFESVYKPMWDNLLNALDFVGIGNTLTFNALELKKRFKMFKQNYPVTLSVSQDGPTSLLEVSQRFDTQHGKKSWGDPLWHDIKTAVPGEGQFEGRVSVNSRYLRELLSTSASKNNPKLVVEVTDSRSPVVFTYPNNSFVHMVMPMHL